MAHHNSIRSIAIAIAASSSLTMASVASAATTQVSPLVALSAFGTPQSAAAISQAGARSQLVALPGTQAPSPAAFAASASMVQGYDNDRYDRETNFLPLLIAIGAMIAIIVIFHDEFFGEGGEINLPIPISPP
jgi:hypothetical protein